MWMLASVSFGCSERLERGADLAVNVTPEIIFFENVEVDTVALGTATIEHVGPSGILRLGEPDLIGDGQFSITSLAPRELSPGESAVLTVEFRPSDQVLDNAAIVIPHNMPSSEPIVISVVATPQRPVIEANPYVIDFGGVEALAKKTLPLTLRNTGTYPAEVKSIGLDLFGGAPFSLPPDLQLPLAIDVGETLDLAVTFSPPNSGQDTAYEAQIRIESPQFSINGRIIPIKGVSRHQMMDVEPGFIAFGWVTIGTPEVRELVIRNNGLRTLSISNIELVDNQETVGALGIPPLPLLLEPLQSRTISITFNPEVANDDPNIGKIIIETDDYLVPDRQVDITGRGARPAISFVPEPVVDFGVVAVLHRHVRPLRITNLGDVPLEISAIEVTAGADDGYEIVAVPELPLQLAANGSAIVQLGYTNPGNIDGLSWGTVTVSSNDPVSPSATIDLRARNTGFPGCEPRFEPPAVDFGTLASGSQTTRTIRVFNDGSMPCVYKTAAIVDCEYGSGLCQTKAGVSSSFFLQAPKPEKNTIILWDTPLELTVRYEPNKESSTDAAIPIVTMQSGIGGPFVQYASAAGGINPILTGQVGTAGVRVDPPSLTWPLTTKGCNGTTENVHITRVGPQPIDLINADTTLCDNQFTFEQVPILPIPLYTEDESAVVVQVRFTPDSAGLHTCVVPFEPSEPDAGVGTLELTGVAAETAERVDVFQQVDDVDVDILFVVDNSGSMGDEQSTLAAGFGGFIAQAQVWNVQYHIGVISTDLGDEGRLLGAEPWVNNLTSNLFVDSVLLGTEGSGDERGLQTAWLALQPDMLIDHGVACSNDLECGAQFAGSYCVKGKCGGYNRGFLRSEALLAIIWISDEQEHTCSTPVDDFVSFFKSIKGNNVKGYAIVGDPKSPADPVGGCGGGGSACDPCDECSFGGNPFGGPGQGAEAGTRYAVAAESLGGFWSSICSFGAEGVDQPALLEEIGKDAFKPVDTFELSETASPGSITVKVNQEICNDFEFNPITNRISFPDVDSECFPGPNSLIEVTYDAPCLL
jgi:hypothetical protein